MSEDLSKELRRIRDRKLENLLRTLAMKKELVNQKSTGTLPERTLAIEFSDLICFLKKGKIQEINALKR